MLLSTKTNGVTSQNFQGSRLICVILSSHPFSRPTSNELRGNPFCSVWELTSWHANSPISLVPGEYRIKFRRKTYLHNFIRLFIVVPQACYIDTPSGPTGLPIQLLSQIILCAWNEKVATQIRLVPRRGIYEALASFHRSQAEEDMNLWFSQPWRPKLVPSLRRSCCVHLLSPKYRQPSNIHGAESFLSS